MKGAGSSPSMPALVNSARTTIVIIKPKRAQIIHEGK